MTIVHAILFGIVEGITEFLPISSTAHLMITSQLLGIIQTDFVKTFEIAIQAGAIIAVTVLYAQKIIQNPRLISKIIIGCIPTGVIGLFAYTIVKTHLLGNMALIVWTLGLGGLFLILFEYWYQRKQNKTETPLTSEISYSVALWMGVCQAIAIIPGISRSAATIIGGLIARVSRVAVVEFSFLLAAPTMFAATAFDVYKNQNIFSESNNIILLVGLLTSFIVAYASIQWFIRYVQTHSFSGFGWYRIIIAIIIGILFVF